MCVSALHGQTIRHLNKPQLDTGTRCLLFVQPGTRLSADRMLLLELANKWCDHQEEL